MKREIIKINEELCNGCGECITSCAEGALQLIDGVAKLVKDDFCDGFGDCIGNCPTGALKIETREAVDFDEEAVVDHLMKTRGPEAVEAMKAAQAKHEANHGGNEAKQPPAGGCPGSRLRVLNEEKKSAQPVQGQNMIGTHAIPSELTQWPVQLHLLNPAAPFLKGRELVLLSTCSPIASGDVHWRFIRGRSVAVACPKLDNTAPYAQKLAAILAENDIPKLQVVIMEVPCCKGLSHIVKEALSMIPDCKVVVEEHVVTVEGDLREVNSI